MICLSPNSAEPSDFATSPNALSVGPDLSQLNHSGETEGRAMTHTTHHDTMKLVTDDLKTFEIGHDMEPRRDVRFSDGPKQGSWRWRPGR
jgi:hypothetical protein